MIATTTHRPGLFGSLRSLVYFPAVAPTKPEAASYDRAAAAATRAAHSTRLDSTRHHGVNATASVIAIGTLHPDAIGVRQSFLIYDWLGPLRTRLSSDRQGLFFCCFDHVLFDMT